MKRRSDDERGAVAVFVALTMVLVLGIGALAVDLGMQRVSRRDMQAIADVVALDMARALTQKTVAELANDVNPTYASGALAQSLARNNKYLGKDLNVTVALGYLDGSGNFIPMTLSTDKPTAVKVTAAAKVGFVFTRGEGPVSRTAIAQSTTSACHKLGSIAVAVNSGDSTLLAPLNDLLGLNLSLLSYQNLAGVGLSLSDLAATGQVGTESSLLTQSVSFANLLSAAISALNSEKPSGYAAAVTVLQSLQTIQGTVPAVQLGQLLNMSTADEAALQTDINLLDLLSGAIQIANGKHAVAIPALQTGVPGLGNQFTSSLFIQEPAKIGCGQPNSVEARATNTQLSGSVGLDFVNLPTLSLNTVVDLGVVKGTLQTTKAVGALNLKLGLATSQLIDPPAVSCNQGTAASPHTMSVTVSSSLETYSLSTTVTVSGSVKVDLGLTALSVDVNAVVDLSLSSPGPASTQTVQLKLPPNDTTPVQVGTGLTTLSLVPSTATVTSLSATTTVAGLSVPVSLATQDLISAAVIDGLVNGSQSFVTKALTPLANNIDTMLVAPLAKLLGLRIGGADVFAVSASCYVPALRG